MGGAVWGRTEEKEGDKGWRTLCSVHRSWPTGSSQCRNELSSTRKRATAILAWAIPSLSFISGTWGQNGGHQQTVHQLL